MRPLEIIARPRLHKSESKSLNTKTKFKSCGYLPGDLDLDLLFQRLKDKRPRATLEYLSQKVVNSLACPLPKVNPVHLFS